MPIELHLAELGFSKYEAACYLALLQHAPVNGSQLSRLSGVSRSKIYEVLGRMANQGYVVSLADGLYAPLPPEELSRRLRTRFEDNIVVFDELESVSPDLTLEYVWTVKGLRGAVVKAREMINLAEKELYLRIHQAELTELKGDLTAAQNRGAAVRLISIGPSLAGFPVQVSLDDDPDLERDALGRPIEVVADRDEALIGHVDPLQTERSIFKWARHPSLVDMTRDGLRHDFLICLALDRIKPADRHRLIEQALLTDR